MIAITLCFAFGILTKCKVYPKLTQYILIRVNLSKAMLTRADDILFDQQMAVAVSFSPLMVTKLKEPSHKILPRALIKFLIGFLSSLLISKRYLSP